MKTSYWYGINAALSAARGKANLFTKSYATVTQYVDGVLADDPRYDNVRKLAALTDEHLKRINELMREMHEAARQAEFGTPVR